VSLIRRNTPIFKGLFEQLTLLLKITHSRKIIRRYFIVNGFDGALAMLGIIMGFYVSDRANLPIIINACLGAAIALGMSGLTSAYISETAEQKKELHDLEQAMLKDLDNSAYGQAARQLPFVIAVVNGLSPLVISLIIISPIWAATLSLELPFGALEFALMLALCILFLLGVFLGRISGTFWLWSGMRTLIIAAATLTLIFLLATS
jgi:predicted membrane protein (TIGR00267 family)